MTERSSGTAVPVVESRIVLVDDDEALLRMVRRLLENAGYENVECWSDPARATEAITADVPDLVVLDLQMPGMSGFQVLDRLSAARSDRSYLPVIVLTSDTSRETKKDVFDRGANDFVAKPVSPSELRYRVRNQLETRRLQRVLERTNERLEEKVQERTAELEAARIELLERLALAAEYRDDDTGAHTRRVGEMAYRIGRRLGLEDDELDTLRRAAPLHDVGKIGISDQILLKPGPLTDEEYQAMKRHTLIGEQILSDSRFPVLETAAEIARSHHENWDGSGYPDGLEGEAIPLSARIVSVADVFDSLTHERVYKEAAPVPEALEEIRRLVGTKFQPRVAEAFFDAVADGGFPGTEGQAA